MIALSAFDYEKKLKNPSKLFTNTWKSKSFINGPAVKEFENKFSDYNQVFRKFVHHICSVFYY